MEYNKITTFNIKRKELSKNDILEIVNNAELINRIYEENLTDLNKQYIIKTKDKSEISIYSYISFPLEIIALILIIFGTLIYEEIVIVNKYGLNLNVKRGIIERSEEEMKTVLFELKETFEELDEIDNNDEDVSIIM